MTGLASLRALAAGQALFVSGAFHPGPDDGLPDGIRTLVLLSPDEPGFWAHLTAMPEWQDGAPDPLDRWSARVMGEIAARTGGSAFLPFGGPPYHPFIAWAKRSGAAFASPVSLLVHDRMGLFASYRGAIGLAERLDLPPPPANPCDSCADKPCLSACPAAALTGAGYDLAACHDYLDTQPGKLCLSGGCQVRSACPVSRKYGRLPEQSAYHMRLFHP